MINYFEFVLVLIVIALGFWVFKLYQDKKESERESSALAKEREEYAEMGKGLAEYNQKLQEKKEQTIVKILEMFTLRQAQGAQARISNREVAESLGISSATVRRYFDDLEAQGKVKQVGKDGRNVYYSVI